MRAIFVVIFFSATTVCSAQSYTFVFLNNKPDKKQLPKEEVDKIMEGHIANIERLAKESKLIVAGPFEGGGGIFILNTTSIDSASKWLSTDPGIQANRWNIEILPYQPRTGSVCAVSEDAEMITHHFVRFTTTGSTSKELVKQHDDHIASQFPTTDVITEAIFDEHGNGILLLKGELKSEIFEADPAIQQGGLQFTVRKLWVAKGAFCEK
jgi:uncharacterized protein YciI